MTEAANSLSAAAGKGFFITRNPYLQSIIVLLHYTWYYSSFRFGHGSTRLGSDLRAMAPWCLSRENARRTTTVLHQASWGDDFDQTPVSIIFRENVQSCFCFCGRSETGQRDLRVLHYTGTPVTCCHTWYFSNKYWSTRYLMYCCRYMV